MPTRRRLTAVIAFGAVLLGIGIVVVHVWLRPPLLVSLGGDSDTLPQQRGQPLVFQELLVCAEPAGEVHVVDVRATEPHQGFVVTGWGWAYRGQLGLEPYTIYPSPLRSVVGFHPGPVTFTSRCDDADGVHRDRPVVLAIEAHRERAESAWTVGVDVDYISGGRRHTVTIPATLGICVWPRADELHDSPCPPAGT